MAILAVFGVCALALIAMLRMMGFELRTDERVAWMTVVVAAAAIFFSLALAWQIVPGSRQPIPFWLVVALSGFVVTGAVTWIFSWHGAHNFASEGWPCAVMELAIKAPAAGVFWLLALRGAVFRGARLGTAVTGLAVILR